MLSTLYSKFEANKTVTWFFLLTYFDKILSFLLPFLVLFVLKDKEVYSSVEFIISYATIAMVVLELGIGSYLFYGYRNAADKQQFVNEAQRHFNLLGCLYLLAAIAIVGAAAATGSEMLWLASFVSMRACFMLFIGVYSSVYRLNDNPGRIYLWTITASFCSMLFLMAAYYLRMPNILFYYFLPGFFIPVVFVIRTFRKQAQFQYRDFVVFLGQSLRFSWPIIANVLAMTYVGNYAKIYAFNNLSQQEMVELSYVMRIGLLIQLTHTAFSSYFSKSMFMKEETVLDIQIFRKYTFVLLLSLALVFMSIIVSNALFGSFIRIPLTVSTFLILLYIIVWCYIGYLELYFGLMNANRRILYYSLVSAVLYTMLIRFSPNIDLFKISLFMFLSSICNLLMVVIGLKSLGVLDFNTARER